MQNKLLTIFYFIFSLSLFSCQDKNPCNLSVETLNELSTLDSLINTPEVRKFNKEWMKNNYNEPTLFNAKTETYRFIWNSSFDGTKIYRIEDTNGHYKVVKKAYANSIDTVGVTSEFEISKEVWDNIVNGLAAKNFWTHPFEPKKKTMYLDPTIWTLEGYKPIKDKCTLKNYHFVSRNSSDDRIFISMCKLFFELKEN